jgi:NDP-sugar pyrophosphorylase family protein
MAFDAVLLAAGHGTRMRPLTNVIPKALLPYRDRPLLHAVLEELFAAGASRTRILIGSGPSQLIRKHLESAELTTAGWSTTDVETIEISLTQSPEPVQALSQFLPPSSRVLLAAHCDEIVPAQVTRLLAQASASANNPVIAVLNRSLSAPRIVKLRAAQPLLGTALQQLPDDLRMTGRMALPADLVRELRLGEITARTLAELVAVLLRLGRPVLALQWPGPYQDVGDLWRYRNLWISPSDQDGDRASLRT